MIRTINVTQADIDAGRGPYECKSCPVALAVNRDAALSFGVWFVGCYGMSAKVYAGGEESLEVRIISPAEVSLAATAFDNAFFKDHKFFAKPFRKKLPKPFTFDLEIPDELVKYLEART